MEGFEIGAREGLREGCLSVYVTRRQSRLGLVGLGFRALVSRLAPGARLRGDHRAIDHGAHTPQAPAVATDGEVDAAWRPRSNTGACRLALRVVRAGARGRQELRRPHANRGPSFRPALRRRGSAAAGAAARAGAGSRPAPRRGLGGHHAARQAGAVPRSAPVPRHAAEAADRRSREPRRAALQRLAALLHAPRQVPTLHLRGPRALLRRRRARDRRHQHRARARVQGRAHQRGAGGASAIGAFRPARRNHEDRRDPSSFRHAPRLGRPAPGGRSGRDGAQGARAVRRQRLHLGPHAQDPRRRAELSVRHRRLPGADGGRGHGEPRRAAGASANSFDALRISPRQIVVDSFEWDEQASAFNPSRSSSFRRTPGLARGHRCPAAASRAHGG